MKTRKRPFANSATLQEMLELRGKGWSLPALARRYHVRDHAAIQYHCKRNGMYFGHDSKRNLTVFYHSPESVAKDILDVVLVWWKVERINPGKMYKEYVADYNKRHPDHKMVIPNPTNYKYAELPTISHDLYGDTATYF